MAPKKKTVKNAFAFFLDDYVETQRKMGRNISRKIGAEECSTMWKELPECERLRYSKMACDYKTCMASDKKNKFTSYGLSLAEVEEEQKLLRQRVEKEDNEIKSTISNLDYDMLCTNLFYLVHCNYYCKNDEGVYVPGEIAISEFSLRDGFRRSYHSLVNPGKIPLGFAYEAHQNIEEIHKLPYPPYSEGNSDYFQILQEILNFLEPGKLPDGRYPPLYCLESNIKASQNIFQALSETETYKKVNFRIYLLQKIFFCLKNKCSEYASDESDKVGFPIMSNAILELEKDIFCYVPGISCAFHCSMEEKYHNCSLSIVRRYVYVICDHCCDYLNIDIIPGKHSRLNCDTNRTSTAAQIEEEMKQSRASSVVDEKIKKADIEGICSFYGGNNVSSWTKVTSDCFNEILDGPDKDFTTINSNLTSASRGRGNRSSRSNVSSNDEGFSSLPRGRGSSHILL